MAHTRRELGYPLPGSVGRAIAALTGRGTINVVSNFGLAFHRFLKYTSDLRENAPDWSWDIIDYSGRKEKKIPQKPKMWAQIIDVYAAKCFEPTAAGADILRDVLNRRQALASAHAKRFGQDAVQAFRMSVGWRLAIGLGAANVLENGINLHRIYGFPMIPGSAVKGIVRHREFCQLAEQFKIPALPLDEVAKKPRQPTFWDLLAAYLQADARDQEQQQDRLQALAKESPEFKREQRQRQDEFRAAVERFRTVFGTPHQEGRVVFCDALPVSLVVKGQPIVELDIVNPHFPKYYRDSANAPTDGDNPSPNNFLVVRQGTCFDFLLLSSDAGVLEKRLLTDIKDSTRMALTDIGIGAKTSANYGWFVPSERLQDGPD